MLDGLKFLTALLVFLLLSNAAEISNVNLYDLSITPTSAKVPHLGWLAAFTFFIPDISGVTVGDTFTLDLEHIYRVKFGGTTEASNMTVALDDGTDALQCYATQQAAYIYDSTIVQCKVITDLSKYSYVSGQISFTFNFNSGGSIHQYELSDAAYFKSGTMTVPFGSGMSADVEFDSTPKPTNMYYIGRTTTYGTIEVYYLDMICPDGKLLGGTQQMQFDTTDGQNPITCSTVQAYLADEYNDWWLPTSYGSNHPDVVCYDNTIDITVTDASAGDMLFVNALQDIYAGSNILSHTISGSYSCVNTLSNITYTSTIDTTAVITATAGSASMAMFAQRTPAVITSTTTTGWTGTFTTTYSTEITETTGTDGSTTPEIIYHVETPSSLITVTSTTTTGWTGTFTTTYSTEFTETTGTDGSTTPEIIYHVETPSTIITSNTSTGWTGTFTTTYSTEITETTGPDSSTTPETSYYVETPSSLIIVTSTTENKPCTSAKTETTTLDISTPATIYIKTQTTTSIIYWTESYATTYSIETQYTVESGSISIPNIIYHIKTPDISTVSTSIVSSAASTTANNQSQNSKPAASTHVVTTTSTVTSNTETTMPLVQYSTSSISSSPYTPQSMKIFSDSANKYVSTSFNFIMLLFSIIFLI